MSPRTTPLVQIGPHLAGIDAPCLVIAELGINHSGNLHTALRMIDVAKASGADFVKLQKREPEIAVPAGQRDVPRDTPWGPMTYLAYKQRIEFGQAEYDAIDRHCRKIGISWFASVWDEPSVAFLRRYHVPALKIPSACLTDDALLRASRATGLPMILSTGMSTLAEIDHAVAVAGQDDLVLMHATSTYPASVDELNLRCVPALVMRYPRAVPGYSGHETGLSTTLCAVVLGACVIERHFTLDRAAWGTDQAASLEPAGFATLVRDIRKWERARGDGVKRVWPSELPVKAKLRRIA